MSAGHVRRVVSRANAASRAPDSFAAWADGRISTDQAAQLFRLADTVPDVFPDAEEVLVEIVELLTVSETAKTLDYWRQSVAGPGETSLESEMTRRGVSASETLDGMLRVDGWMTPLAGQAFLAGLQAHLPPRASTKGRLLCRYHHTLEHIRLKRLERLRTRGVRAGLTPRFGNRTMVTGQSTPTAGPRRCQRDRQRTGDLSLAGRRSDLSRHRRE